MLQQKKSVDHCGKNVTNISTMEQLSLFLQKQILTLSVFRVVFFLVKTRFRAAEPTHVFFDQGWWAQTVNIIDYDIDDSSFCENSLAGFTQFFSGQFQAKHRVSCWQCPIFSMY